MLLQAFDGVKNATNGALQIEKLSSFYAEAKDNKVVADFFSRPFRFDFRCNYPLIAAAVDSRYKRRTTPRIHPQTYSAPNRA